MSSIGYYGDPGAMRAEAASAQLKAEQISALANRLMSQADSIDFQGPAADAFRQAMSDRTQRAESAAAELQGVASTLLNASAYAEDELARERAEEQRRLDAESSYDYEW